MLDVQDQIPFEIDVFRSAFFPLYAKGAMPLGKELSVLNHERKIIHVKLYSLV